MKYFLKIQIRNFVIWPLSLFILWLRLVVLKNSWSWKRVSTSHPEIMIMITIMVLRRDFLKIKQQTVHFFLYKIPFVVFFKEWRRIYYILKYGIKILYFRKGDQLVVPKSFPIKYRLLYFWRIEVGYYIFLEYRFASGNIRIL